jgi:hypothetical protein
VWSVRARAVDVTRSRVFRRWKGTQTRKARDVREVIDARGLG